MAQSYSSKRPLTELITNLRTEDEAARDAHAEALRLYVEAKVRDMPQQEFSKFTGKLNHHLLRFLNSSDTLEVLGGVRAVKELIDSTAEANAIKVSRFGTGLLRLLPSQSPEITEEAAKAMGHLAKAGGSLTSDFVTHTVTRAFEWLRIDAESSRLAAVWVLAELAWATPTLFTQHVADVLKEIWVAVRDHRRQIRTVGVRVISACVSIMHEREARWAYRQVNFVFSEVQKGLKSHSSAESIHGSLMTLGELLKHTGEFMLARFRDACDTAFRFKDNHSLHVRHTVINLLPRLAAFCPPAFERFYFSISMTYLRKALKSNDDRSRAFIAIGEMAVALTPEVMVVHVDSIVEAIHQALVPGGAGQHGTSKDSGSKEGADGNSRFCKEALTCIEMLTDVLPDAMRPHLTEALLSNMFARCLSVELVRALTVLGRKHPQLLPVIQALLLDCISIVLARMPFSVSYRLKGPASLHYQRSYVRDSATIQLALRTLGTFDFTGYSLANFVREVLVTYLDNDDAQIRKEAALSCCSVLIGRGDMGPASGHAAVVVHECVAKLLVVGVADPEPSIREAVLSALDSRYDHHLCQVEFLRSVFIALNDESFAARRAAVRMIGRLALLNPACVMPTMRKVLIQLLTELELSSDVLSKESNARLLGTLVRSSPDMVAPYSDSILRTLLMRIADPNPAVATSIFVALGNLARVSGGELAAARAWIFPEITRTLNGQSNPQKRRAVLRALRLVIESAGITITPQSEYKQLIYTVVSGLQREENPEVRLDMIRTLGVLGAWDPFMYRQLQLEVHGRKDVAGDRPRVIDEGAGQSEPGETPADEILPSMTCNPDDYYPMVAVYALMRILKNQSLSQHHLNVVQAIVFIFESLGTRSVPYLKTLMPMLFGIIKDGDAGQRGFFFQQLAVLVNVVRQHIRPYLKTLFELIQVYWSHSLLLNQIVALVEEISVSLSDEFKVWLPNLIPHLLTVLSGDKTHDKQTSMKVLHTLEVFGTNLDDYLHFIIPALVKLFDSFEAPKDLSLKAMRTVARLSTILDFTDYASRLMHPLVRVLQHEDGDMRQEAVNTINALVFHLRVEFAPFIPTVTKFMTRNNMSSSLYDQMVSRILRNQPFPPSLAATISSMLQESVPGVEEVPDVGAGGGMAARSGAADSLPPSSLAIGGTGSAMLGSKVPRSGASQAGSAAFPMSQNVGSGGFPSNGGIRGYVQSGSDMDDSELDPDWAQRRIVVSQENLKRAWDPSQCSTKKDWFEWMRKFSVELLRESPSTALRSCSALGEVHSPLARELFNASFISIWSELHESFMDDLISSLRKALESPTIPLEILQVLLNLAEFMEHDEKPLRIEARKLAALSEKCHAFAKALHYWEQDFSRTPGGAIENLISMNNKLQLPEAAMGILAYARQMFSSHVVLRESWYEMLERWDDALVAYEQKRKEEPENENWTIGIMRGLKRLGEWDRLNEISESIWHRVDLEIKKRLAPLAAAGAWNLQKWDKVNEYASVLGDDTIDGPFFRAVLAIHSERYSSAKKHIRLARQLLDSPLQTLVGESYHRAYTTLVKAQQLSEMEEVITYQKCAENDSRRLMIKHMWNERLKLGQGDVEVWQDLLAVHSLVVPAREMLDVRLKLATLAQKSGRVRLAKRVLVELMHNDPDECEHLGNELPQVTYAYAKHLYKTPGGNAKAVQHLSDLAESLKTETGSDNSIFARCKLSLAKWRFAEIVAAAPESGGVSIQDLNSVLAYASEAAPHAQNMPKFWHAWAVYNIHAVEVLSGSPAEGKAPDVPAGAPGEERDERLCKFLEAGVRGYFRSIALSAGSTISDTLRLLTVWFRYGGYREVETALLDGFDSVPVDTWLCVIPQIIARLHSQSTPIRSLIKILLQRIGQVHPQVLVYPLTVASKSASMSRQADALAILDKMRVRNEKLVEQALIVSQELIRVAILWNERWHEALEEASRLYYGKQNVEAMFQILGPLHLEMEKGPTTMAETSFVQAYGKDLQDAYEWCKKYSETGDISDLNNAWDLYYNIFRSIGKQLTQMRCLELHYCSRYLKDAQDLELAVPGAYRSGEAIVRIKSFSPSLQVIQSKQRPRKLTIKGSDGKDYMYLLKGHEDIRQDERVMQLFGLVNDLLSDAPETRQKDLLVQRYSAVPLSPNSGLLGWVPHCDTLHVLIRDFREPRCIMLNLEHRLVMQMAQDFDHLSIAQKIEAFDWALENTAGQDLNKIIWLKSKNSEVWLERRTNYTRSLAVMSIVGYILGLGDRHPSNLMLDRLTGRILHIDFGDCFEVATHREKFPEKIPFRLTRMLVNAMEVSLVEGTFRLTCEAVMRVLRRNKDSVMAMLEAFVYDPLINWKLMEVEESAVPDRTLPATTQAQNRKALSAVKRVDDKLSGHDFPPKIGRWSMLHGSAGAAKVSARFAQPEPAPVTALSVEDQVSKLIKTATLHENLCQLYVGWCPFW